MSFVFGNAQNPPPLNESFGLITYLLHHTLDMVDYELRVCELDALKLKLKCRVHSFSLKGTGLLEGRSLELTYESFTSQGCEGPPVT